MSERKIRCAPNQHGGWWAYIDDLGVAAEKPWEASAALCAVLRDNVTVEWETLPWPILREAYGVTHGVCELLGAATGAQRALARAKWEDRGRWLDCAWCRAPAPWDAEAIGWRWVKLVLFGKWHNNGWACPGCAPWAEPTDPGAKAIHWNPWRGP